MNVRYSLNERIIFIYAFVLEHPAIFFTFFVYNTKYAIKDLVRHILLTINIYIHKMYLQLVVSPFSLVYRAYFIINQQQTINASNILF